MNTSVLPHGLESVFIDKPEEFARVCETLKSAPVLALDTEFIRTNTFYPKPGLLQVTDGNCIYLIDPIPMRSWSDFGRLLRSSETVVIMHSCSEDLSLLQHMLQMQPARLFDTQRAAALLGLGYSLSYQGLVKAELDLDIPKGETRSDWLQRPLTEQQLSYAAVDVAYLIQLYTRLQDRLKSMGRLTWFEQDCAEMLLNVTDETCEENWELAYQGINGAWKLDQDQLALLQKLCYWREAVARERDRPRSWVLKDNELLALAIAVEQNRKEQTTSRVYNSSMIIEAGVLTGKFAERAAGGMVRFLNSPREFQQPAQLDDLDAPLTSSQRGILKRLQLLTQTKAEQMRIAPELLARKRQWLELLYQQKRADATFWPQGMDGWRKDILYGDALKILHEQGSRNE